MPVSASRTITHFAHCDDGTTARLFHQRPRPIDAAGDHDIVATALGATLYIPATRPGLVDAIRRAHDHGCASIVIDTEDAVADDEVDAGLSAACNAVNNLGRAANGPLVFVRVRAPEHIDRLVDAVHADGLHGVVIPKFGADNGVRYLQRIADARATRWPHLVAMPIIESPRLVITSERESELASIAAILDDYRAIILAVRIGATDLCGVFGVRRDQELTIYDVHPVAVVISTIVATLGRRDGTGHIITGPVWEYYNAHERLFRPLLRNTPFQELDAVPFRDRLVSRDLDGLLREIVLDRANGLQGKTVIHPSHVAVVHALSAVSHEEFTDALAVLGLNDSDYAAQFPVHEPVSSMSLTPAVSGGVVASSYRNKMNEPRPHRYWALRTLTRAIVFGVMHPEVGVIEFLTDVVGR